MSKKSTFVVSGLLVILLLSTCSFLSLSVHAQGDATVIVGTSDFGTTDVMGTSTYPDGTVFNITATDAAGYAFIGWIVSTDSSSTNYIDNPLSITLTGGTTYNIQPQFQAIQAVPGSNLPTQMANAAVVVVLPSAGGSTSPAPGTYAMADATTMKLAATANTGWQFSHWTICGPTSPHGGSPVNYAPTDNPYTVGHGYGDTYYYQAVFTQTGNGVTQTTPTPSPVAGTVAGLSTDLLIIIALIIVIIVMGIGFAVYAARKK